MPNRLADASSPYLRQHADNPVDWFPWGPEALALADDRHRPILLSVGYAACHWCHVMEHESFSDARIAAKMNSRFVNIKVDREERPDLDALYMAAVQAFSGGHGGWPMTVFLTPDGRPFFAGTYFPPTAAPGRPSFEQILDHVWGLWQQQQGKIADLGDRIVAHLTAAEALPAAPGGIGDGWLDRLADASSEAFDPEHAGFGRAPKFPPSSTLTALLAHHAHTGHRRSLTMATRTLHAMALGGMYDLVGGGFARYSVDQAWRIPHFEKMLYDNALLATAYVEGWRVSGDPTFARVATETLDYLARDMMGEEGLFHASEDADSEGEEGLWYVWTPAELSEILGDDAARAARLLEVTDSGSFEHGTSVLRLAQPLEQLADDERALLAKVLPALAAARETRVRPGRDTKRVTAWNALATKAFARAASAFDRPDYAAIAVRAARALLTLATVDGRLHRVWHHAKAEHPGFLDDHAFLVDALVDVWEATFDTEWIEHALALADQTIALFHDAETGSFFFSGHDGEQLVARVRKTKGGAEPSAVGTFALALTRLAALTGRADLGEHADRILETLRPISEAHPRAVDVAAVAARWRTGGGREIGIVTPDGAGGELLAEVRRRHLPFAVLACVADGPPPSQIPWMADRGTDLPTAYVCTGATCQLPATDLDTLRSQLARPARAHRAGFGRVRAPELPADPALWLNSAGPLQLSALRGQVVVLDFFTQCCINCQHVLPELAAVEQHFSGAPVSVIGVHSAKFTDEKTAGSVARAIERHGIRHPVVLDGDHAVWDRFAIRSWPTVVVVDPSGRIAWQKAGEVTREELIERIGQLLEDHADTLAEAAPPSSDPRAPGGTLSFPGKLHVAHQKDGETRVYIADSGHHRILETRLTEADGWPTLEVLRTFGDGEPGLEDGAAPRFRDPQGIFRQGATLWVADTGNHAVRRIDLKTGAASTMAGNGALGRGGELDPAKPQEMSLRSPWDVAAAGEMVIVAMAGTHQLWIHLPEDGVFGPFVGSGQENHVDGPAGDAQLAQPSGLAFAGGNVLWVDSETSSVRWFDLQAREAGTIVGGGLFDFGDVDGAAKEVLLQHPLGIAAGHGHVWIADTYNHKIKAISLSDGRTRTVSPADAGLVDPSDVALLETCVLIADTGNHRIVAMDVDGVAVREVPLR